MPGHRPQQREPEPCQKSGNKVTRPKQRTGDRLPCDHSYEIDNSRHSRQPECSVSGASQRKQGSSKSLVSPKHVDNAKGASTERRGSKRRKRSERPNDDAGFDENCSSKPEQRTGESCFQQDQKENGELAEANKTERSPYNDTPCGRETSFPLSSHAPHVDPISIEKRLQLHDLKETVGAGKEIQASKVRTGESAASVQMAARSKRKPSPAGYSSRSVSGARHASGQSVDDNWSAAGDGGRRADYGRPCERHQENVLLDVRSTRGAIPKPPKHDAYGRSASTVPSPRLPTDQPGFAKDPEDGGTRSGSSSTYQYMSTHGKQIVKIYTADITGPSVDAVVNSVSCNLELNGRVAKAIRRAALCHLQQKCNDLVTRRGPLEETEVVSTTGGRLCKLIIHAVGPVKSNGELAETRLLRTFENCLWEAEKKCVKSIAIPAIGGGNLQMKKSVIGESLCHAVARFCSDLKNLSTLKEIHLIDTDERQTEETNSWFQRRTKNFVFVSPIPAKVDGGNTAVYDVTQPAPVHVDSCERHTMSEMREGRDPVPAHNYKAEKEALGRSARTAPVKSDYRGTYHTRDRLPFQNGNTYDISGHGATFDQPLQGSPITESPSAVSVPSSTHKVYDYNQRAYTDVHVSHPADQIGPKEPEGGATGRGSSNTYQYISTGSKHIVKIYSGDITELPVDVIVNSVNCNLDLTGAVAKAIKRAAGPTMQKECKEWVRRKGPLMETQVAATTGGRLWKYVIHAAGPANPRDRLANSKLVMTFENCLREAEALRATSIAIPAIGGGNLNMKKSVVGENLCDAVARFCSHYENLGTLKEIHLIDRNERQTEETNSWFQRRPKSFIFCSPATAKLSGGHTAVHDVIRPAPDQALTFVDPATSELRERRHPASAHGYKAEKKTLELWAQTAPVKPDYRGERHPEDDVTSRHGYTDISRHGTPSHKPQQDSPVYGATSALGVTSLTRQNTSECPICFDVPKVATKLKCGHTFCTGCIDRSFAVKRSCPVCGVIYGTLTGNQPVDGSMNVSSYENASLPGYEGYGVIIIQYYFPSGIQTTEHPCPGIRYDGTSRIAYLPKNREGKRLLKLLQKAFEARLTFTVGQSVTTGRRHQVTWNDIHHKTSMSGGPARFGYPDPTYLDRVREELAVKGIQ